MVRGAPKFIRSDNGPEFIADAIDKWLKGNNVETLHIVPGSPWENSYIESFNGKLRDDVLDREVFHSVKNGYDVACLQVKVITRAVKVNRKKVNTIQAILPAICLQHHEQSLFSNAIGSIGLFRITVPEVFFLERWHGCKFRVCIDSTNLNELLDSARSCSLNQMQTHSHIGIKEPAGILPVTG